MEAVPYFFPALPTTFWPYLPHWFQNMHLHKFVWQPETLRCLPANYVLWIILRNMTMMVSVMTEIASTSPRTSNKLQLPDNVRRAKESTILV
jgi:hypothetical protein